MELWRLCKRRHASTPLDGLGAQRYGGRWNRPGVAIAYTSATLSLAALEMLVHLDADLAPNDLVSVRLSVPEGLAIESIENERLPKECRSYPAPSALQELGGDWVRGGTSAVLRVPSALVPQEFNFLVNPGHPDSRQILVLEIAPFRFDPRLF